jgi:hypothetical protein
MKNSKDNHRTERNAAKRAKVNWPEERHVIRRLFKMRCPFGGLAIPVEGPMALRPTLTDGLPFRGPRRRSLGNEKIKVHLDGARMIQAFPVAGGSDTGSPSAKQLLFIREVLSNADYDQVARLRS